MMVRRDHLLHIVVSFALAVVGGFLLGRWWGISAALVAGIVKEIDDWRTKRGTPEWDDMAANIAGLALAWAVLALLGV